MSVYNLPLFIQIDSLAGMASLSLGGSAAPHTQSMQGFPPNLGSAFSTPQSPAKAFPPLSTQNQTTGFSGIGGLSSQLPGTAIWVGWFVFLTYQSEGTVTAMVGNTGQTAVSRGRELHRPRS